MGKLRKRLNKKMRALSRANLGFAKFYAGLLSAESELGLRNDPTSMTRQIRAFMPEMLEKGREKDLRRLRRDMRLAWVRYRMGYDEYFLYGFPMLSDEGRRAFVGDRERNRLCNRLGTEETHLLLDHKNLTYEKFQPYFHREVLCIASEDDRERMLDFIGRHPDLMVKHEKDSMGRGIYRVRTDAPDFDVGALFAEILAEKRAVILEETVHQSAELAEFHPSSVNTVRIATYCKDGEVSVLFTFLKLGTGGKCVDNGGAGGILASIDPASGIVRTLGRDETGKRYLFHPDTGKQIIGFELPEWPAAIELAGELARQLPEHSFIGWDFAHTDDGWVLIEGNRRSQFIGPQLTEGVGYRDVIEATIRAELVRRRTA